MSPQVKKWLMDILGFIIAVIVIVNVSVLAISYSQMKLNFMIAVQKDD